MANILGYYYIPSGLPKEVSKIIVDNYLNTDLEISTISDAESLVVDKTVRKSKNIWIPTDNWVSGMMAHFIHSANEKYFHFDLEKWSDLIQYTVYEDRGSHYSWHYDTVESPFSVENKLLVRKLSISLLLSSKEDFDGGQFQIMVGNNKMETVDMDIGDVVIFPSDAMHRIRPLKSGKRISLVGWYAGPPLR